MHGRPLVIQQLLDDTIVLSSSSFDSSVDHFIIKSRVLPHLRIALGCALGVQRHLVHALDLVPLLPQQQRRPRPCGCGLLAVSGIGAYAYVMPSKQGPSVSVALRQPADADASAVGTLNLRIMMNLQVKSGGWVAPQLQPLASALPSTRLHASDAAALPVQRAWQG